MLIIILFFNLFILQVYFKQIAVLLIILKRIWFTLNAFSFHFLLSVIFLNKIFWSFLFHS